MGLVDVGDAVLAVLTVFVEPETSSVVGVGLVLLGRPDANFCNGESIDLNRSVLAMPRTPMYLHANKSSSTRA